MKSRGYTRPLEGFRPIHMPKNTGSGVILAGFSTVCGMALIWYIWWLAALAFAGVIATAIWHTFNYDRDYNIPAAEVIETEGARSELMTRGA
jgi:cytochrome o ubiquinol oxidase subunit 1